MTIPNRLPAVHFEKRSLPGGGVVIVTQKSDTLLAAVNLLFRTGSRDESPEKTGMAHLMEHLMFSGTRRYPAFDLPISRVGGINNAFTTQDITNYYILLPADHVELAFDLEADRIRNLRLNKQRVEVQKRVVTEEFRQRYLNQPYGDLNHLLCAASYRLHPYRWPTIGLSPENIGSMTPGDIADFYRIHYNPANMILSVAGNVDTERIFALAETHFGSFPPANPIRNSLPAEPATGRSVKEVVYREVPSSLLLVAFPMPGLDSPDYAAFEFLADILGQGMISRLHIALVKERKVFTRISSSLTGTMDPGLFTISGLLADPCDPDDAVESIQEVISTFVQEGPTTSEMKSVVNGMITSTLLKRQQVMNLAMELAMTEAESNADKANNLFNEYQQVDMQKITTLAKRFLVPENRIEIHYLKK